MQVFKWLLLVGTLPVSLFVGVEPAKSADYPLSIIVGERKQSFDLSDLDALPQQRLVTATTWAEGEKEFSGPLVRDLLLEMGIEQNVGTVRAKAFNGYEVSIPLKEFHDWDVLIATRDGGQPIPVRERGPYRLVYDFAQVGAQKDSNWIWMLKEIVVEIR